MTWVLQKSKNLIWYTSRFFIGFCHKYAKHQAEISSVFAGHIIESKVHGGHFGKQNNSMSDILVIFRNN
jgi:hypothetical protein